MVIHRIEYLTLMRNVFNLLCILPAEKKNLWRIWLIAAYRSTIMILLILRLAGEVMDFVQNISDTHEWPKIACMVIISTSSTSRMAIFVYKKKDTLRLLRLWEMLFPNNPAIRPRLEVVRKSIKESNIFLVTVTTLAYVGLLHWLVYPIFIGSGSPGNRKLPFRAWYPIDVYASPTYELIYVLQSLNAVAATFTSVLSATTFRTFCMLTRGQALELKEQLRRIGDTGKDAETTRETSGKRRDVVEAEILRCVKHHSAIIRFVREMEDYFGPLLVIEYFALTTPLCFAAIEVTSGSLDDTSSLAWMEYFLACSFTLYFFCWYGSEVTLQLLSIQSAVSEALCGHITDEMRWKLRFMMLHSNVEVIITGGGIFRTSLDTFENMIGFVVSNFLFFRELKQPKNV